MNDQVYGFKVGDVVKPSDGSSYRCVITYISDEEDTVKTRDLASGKEYEISCHGLFVRYMHELDFG